MRQEPGFGILYSSKTNTTTTKNNKARKNAMQATTISNPTGPSTLEVDSTSTGQVTASIEQYIAEQPESVIRMRQIKDTFWMCSYAEVDAAINALVHAQRGINYRFYPPARPSSANSRNTTVVRYNDHDYVVMAIEKVPH